jgi:hypothetical protein
MHVSSRELSEVEMRDLALDLRPYMERTPFVVRPAASKSAHTNLQYCSHYRHPDEPRKSRLRSGKSTVGSGVRAGAPGAGVPPVPGPGAAPPVCGAGAAHGSGPAHPQGW